MGDFNYPDIDWELESCNRGLSHPASLFLECTRDCFLTQLVKMPTHYRGSQAHNTLDLILTNKEETVGEVLIEAPLGKSHHAVILFNINCNLHDTSEKKDSYIYDKGNYSEIRSELSQIDWERELLTKGPENCWTFLKDTLLSAERRHIPKHRFRNKKVKRTKPIWMNQRALEKVKKKHAAWRNYLKAKDRKTHEEYCKARNQARWATRQAMKEYERGIAGESKKNPKAFYRYVRSKIKPMSPVADLITDSGIAKNDKHKADALNNFFMETFTIEPLTNLPNINVKPVNEPLQNITFTEKDVRDKLKV